MSGSRVAACWELSAGRMDECLDQRLLQPSVQTLIHPTYNSRPAATREPDGLCGNQRYRRELMMGIMVPDTCWA